MRILQINYIIEFMLMFILKLLERIDVFYDFLLIDRLNIFNLIQLN